MIYNYLKIAFRSLLKYRFIFFTNLFGLTVGFTCCLLIFVYILHELSYDKYNKNADRTYRVTRLFRNAETGATNLNLGAVAPPFAPLLENDFKEIETITRLFPVGTTTLRYNDKVFNERNVYMADEHFHDIFSMQVTKGNPATALKDPYTVMLTEEMAEKYFGKEDPMNKLIGMYDDQSFKVTGIFKPFPSNAHFHPSILVSFNTLKDSAVYGERNLRTNWGNNAFYTYMLLPANYDAQKLEAQFPAFLDRHLDPGAPVKASRWTQLSLQKLTDIHLHSHLDSELEENGDIKRVYIFSAIALFILLIACINYMNLSTARSVLRAKEIGIRKVVGAERRELIFQFLSESSLITWMAMILAFGLTWQLLPFLNNLSGQTLSISALFHWQIMLPVLLAPFLVGLIAGIYPALFMSSFKPIKVLKGFMKTGGANISFRQVLVTTQFAISIMLIIATAVVFRQLRYMQEKSLGFDRDHIVTMRYNGGLNERYDAFRAELLGNTNIKNTARSSRIPTGRLLDAQGSSIQRGDSLAPTQADIKYVVVDHDFVPTYGVKILAGRNFSRDYGPDTAGFIINHAAVTVLGLKSDDEAVGKNFTYGRRRGKIIGVFNDFHFESMHQRILPLVLVTPTRPDYRRISVKVAGNNMTSALAHIESTWKKFLPETPFEYTFMDENFEDLYKSEQRQGAIFTIFSCIAIAIACLGLFGLSAFAITQRIKEIGIRKVIGASVPNIVTLLSKDFLKLVAVATIIAFPVAWYAMNSWLQDFAYRSTISWWIFAGAGIIAVVIALFTISFQAIKAATANPVKSLRSE
ncbi:FtsX-like permease family protein [Pseudoflavitalea sp. X16]|uniref:ABC transporter permease n=1 Tax=Paraflavitalea devenefica TaxID=2716334 RepID=UPI00142270DC|nr:ABC transporter permease [Paraflavitalea devenefica]NII27993.1 FtsX-like permease family protein [Paraflavitalea devenefica]